MSCVYLVTLYISLPYNFKVKIFLNGINIVFDFENFLKEDL